MEKKQFAEVIGNCKGSGVYQIEKANDGAVMYYGSSFDLADAKNRHASNLRRGVYYNTNKEAMEHEFFEDNLIFRVVKNESDNDKMAKAEGDLINDSDTCCNAVYKITRSVTSNKNKISTWKRKKANMNDNNPRAIISLQQACEILWLKMNTKLKHREIANIYGGISTNLVSRVGTYRWLFIDAIKPDWYIKKSEITTTEDCCNL